jgi:hypothetical protein
LTAWLAGRNTREVLVLIAGTAAVMLLIHPVLVGGHPDHRADGAAVIGIFVGMATGLLLEVRVVGFVSGGRWWKRVVRYVLGMIGLLALLTAAGALLEGVEPRAPFALVSSAGSALWVSFGAPWVFVRTGLAESAR